MAAPGRERVLNVRMTEIEMRMVKALAEHMGLKQSDAVRQLVRQAYRRERLGERSNTRSGGKR